MGLAALGLAILGIVTIVIGVVRIRVPLATIRRLDATEANLQRYDAWRGKRTAVDDGRPTGADEMRAQMRQHIIVWGVVIGAGAALLVVGLLLA